MANCNGNSYNSPIVDANYGFASEIINDNEELTMDRALKNIFMACDKDNTGYALVSDLICFITPHLQSHLPKLMMLRQTLDPDDINPMVDHLTFFTVMNEWTSKVLAESPELNCKRHGVTRESKKCSGETSLGSSSAPKSPQPSLSGDGITESLDSPFESNLYGSNFSISSESDILSLQEHTKQLDHQNRKLIDELENTRSQLSISEEQNEAFQADLERISRRLISEQQLNAQLEKDRQVTAELLETSAAAQKLIGKLEKDLASSEKQLLLLKDTIKKMEEQNQKLEDKINQLTQRETSAKQQITELQNEISTKEQEISSLEEVNTQLKGNLEMQQKEIAECNDINVALKTEKEKLEQCLHDSFKNKSLSYALKPSTSFTENPSMASSGTFKHLNKHLINSTPENNISPMANFTHHYSKQYVSPFQKMLQNKSYLNNPSLRHMLANPVSPCLDYSTLSSSVYSKKSVDSDDSPVFVPNKVKLTSTPQMIELDDKTFLDESLPLAASGLPVLSPARKYASKMPTTNGTESLSQHHFVDTDLSESQKYNNDTNSINNENVNNHTRNISIKRIKETPPHTCNGSDGSDSLPTVYVLERTETALVPKVTDALSTSDITSIINAHDNSSDDDLYWKLQMANYSPHESLEAEMFQKEVADQAEMKATETDSSNLKRAVLVRNTQRKQLFAKMKEFTSLSTKEAFIAFGKYISEELSMLPVDQAFYCQKLISDVTFEAKMGMLNNNSIINLR